MIGHNFILVASSMGIGYLMVKAGLGKNALETRRRRRVCPSCGREILGRTCSGHS
jgi:hypothetical protein